MCDEEKRWAEGVYTLLKEYGAIKFHSSIMIDVSIFYEMGCTAKEAAAALAGRNPKLRKLAVEEARKRDGLADRSIS
jgi:hypothetical protein